MLQFTNNICSNLFFCYYILISHVVFISILYRKSNIYYNYKHGTQNTEEYRILECILLTLSKS